jgi:hypothetical protein
MERASIVDMMNFRGEITAYFTGDLLYDSCPDRMLGFCAASVPLVPFGQGHLFSRLSSQARVFALRKFQTAPRLPGCAWKAPLITLSRQSRPIL